MLSTQLMKLAEQNEWKTNNHEESVFGTYNGYLFTAFEGKGFKTFITPLAGISEEGLEAILNFLKKNQRSLNLRNYEVSDNFLCVRQHEGLFKLSPDKMEYLLAQISGVLSLYELPPDACVVCGESTRKKGLYFGFYCHLHPECLEQEPVDFTGTTFSDNQMERMADNSQAESMTDPEEDTEKTDESATEAPPADAEGASLDSHRLNELAAVMRPWQDEMIAALATVCAIPSVKGDPGEDAPFGAEADRALTAFLDIGRKLGFHAVNLDHYAGYLEMGAGDRLVAGLCHLDVVPAGDGWETDPFQLAVSDGRLIGRGTSDDKGPAIAVLFAMKSLLASNYEPSGRIRLIVGLDEESGSTCMEHYVKTADLPDAGFTADASFPVIYAEKGMCRIDLVVRQGQQPADALRLTGGSGGTRPNVVPGRCSLTFTDASGQSHDVLVEGKPAHASTPWNGKNAISLAMEEAAARLSAVGCQHPFVDFYLQAIGLSWDGAALNIAGSDESGPLTLNAGILHLDEQEARVTLDIRYPVTWSFDELKSTVSKRVAELGGTAEFSKPSLPLYQPKDDALVTTLTAVYEDLTGLDGAPVAIGGGTYARSMPHIVAYGPAFPDDEETAHQAGEYVRIDHLLASAAIYREALMALDRLGSGDQTPDQSGHV